MSFVNRMLEAVIERGLTTFVEVGAALLEIRDRRLYRESHGDFESYCHEKWGFSRQRAHQMIEAAGVVGQLSTMVGNGLPINERQARELARVAPERRAEVWERVVTEHGPRVTAAHIRQTVDPDPPLLSVVDLETGEIVGGPTGRRRC